MDGALLAQEGQSSEAADRYAAAIFELADESNALEAIETDLARFAEAMAANPDLKFAANSPLIPPEEKSSALAAVAEKLGLSTLGRNLIGVAAANRRAGDLPAIAASFGRMLAKKRNQRAVEIVSAAPLDEKQVQAISQALSKALGGQTVQPRVSVDESLIGGFIVRAGSRQFDASLRTKLDNLKLALRAQ